MLALTHQASLGDARDDSFLLVLVLLHDVRLHALHLLVERVDVRAARNEGMRESVAGAWVGGARAVVHLTNASERFDVGIVTRMYVGNGAGACGILIHVVSSACGILCMCMCMHMYM